MFSLPNLWPNCSFWKTFGVCSLASCSLGTTLYALGKCTPILEAWWGHWADPKACPLDSDVIRWLDWPAERGTRRPWDGRLGQRVPTRVKELKWPHGSWEDRWEERGRCHCQALPNWSLRTRDSEECEMTGVFPSFNLTNDQMRIMFPSCF